MIRKFFVDVHLFGPHEIKVEWEAGDDCYSLGDNIDFACCKKKDLSKAVGAWDLLRQAFAHRYVTGNHELTLLRKYMVVDGILMTHGDYIFWTKKNADRYRSRKACVGFFKYWYTKIVFGYILSLITWPISKNVIQKAADWARREGCHTVVCGHWHPKTLQRRVHNGVQIYVLPRGKTVLDI